MEVQKSTNNVQELTKDFIDQRSMSMLDKPIFMISLDTELIWGSTKSEYRNLLRKNKESVRKSIYFLLDILERYQIPVTWAVVGHLFIDSCEKERCLTHKNMVEFGYRKEWYEDPYTDINRDPLFYGRDIIEKVLSSSVNHEIGYHSFSHVVFTEISRELAEGEVREAKKIEKEWGIKFKSFVFPRNEIAHIDVLKENGFKIYRGENLGRYDLSQSFLIRKFNGGINKIIAPPTEPKWMDGIWEIPSSMFFCDPQIKFSVLPRAKLGLYRAIRSKKVFHIFLHPHNLLIYSSLKDDLDKFLAHVSKKRDERKIEVMTMGELASYL